MDAIKIVASVNLYPLYKDRNITLMYQIVKELCELFTEKHTENDYMKCKLCVFSDFLVKIYACLSNGKMAE